MPKAAMHPSTSSVLSTGKGWKECGPFNRRSTSMVLHWDTKAVRHYTARVCIDPVGTTPYHCGAWYVDAS
ncbi:hypothetical protein [Streptomyces sp. NPDC095613]|uniref:hypothetical protein n=1 Tax=Streptomyces sp. NPDC095613 TaxID=3155540 RepID=UPI003326DC6B